MTAFLIARKLLMIDYLQGHPMRYLIYLVLLVSASAYAGAIHKWTDENGNIHYGDAPPVSAKTDKVRVTGVPSALGKALPRLNNPGSAEGDGPVANVPEDQAAIACKQAQGDLSVIGNSDRIRLKTADGTIKYLTSEEITARKQSAESDIKRFCK